jgi:hypothetical protein
MEAALGIRVKSGWASAVLVGSAASSPVFLHRGRLLLSDPRVTKSTQPYHRGFGRLQKDDEVLERLRGIIFHAAALSLSSFVKDCRVRGHRPTTISLVVGSTIDPDRIGNEHIRAHASEAKLFRVSLERAASAAGLPCTVAREKDLRAVGHPHGPEWINTIDNLGRAAGRPWGADEKLAARAAWLSLANIAVGASANG